MVIQDGHDLVGEKDRPNLREEAKSVIDKLGTANYRPIVLDHFTYEDLAGFITQNRKYLSLTKTEPLL